MLTKVKLREKQISGNRHSLYLDFYPAIPHPKTGEPTRREFLGLFLFDKPRNPIDRKHNADTLKIAESIRHKRDRELNEPEIYTGIERELMRIRELGKVEFLPYFLKLTEQKQGSNGEIWRCTFRHLERFAEPGIRFNQVTEGFCNDFRAYLLTAYSIKSKKQKISRKTQNIYFGLFRSALKQAYRDGLLQPDLSVKIKPIHAPQTHREYLSLDELQSLLKTPCSVPELKNASLFSALTGLRYSDVEKLAWGEIRQSPELGYYIQFYQQKTRGAEVLPVSEQAVDLAGQRKEPGDKLFPGLKYTPRQNRKLRQWVKAAGIEKDVTFHNFRHTYATLQLSMGTDIYTVSKMLGHKSLTMTMVYAKLLDIKKIEAANRIRL